MTDMPHNGSKGRGLRLFWQLSRRFWLGGRLTVTGLVALLVAVMLLQLLVQFFLNLWNRHFFDALERRDASELWTQAEMFVPLAGASIVLAATSVWGRMTTQRMWRAAMTRDILESWSAKAHELPIAEGVDGAQNPEYRVVEDVRIATDAPVDLALAFLSSVLTAVTFFSVLWSVGGSIGLEVLGHSVVIPGYLVVGVVGYSTAMTGLMMFFGRRMTSVIESKNQAEAEFRAAAEILRGDRGESEGEAIVDKANLLRRLRGALHAWRDLCWQLVATTLVSHCNFLFAPVAAYFLCFPKYLSGAMSLGEVTQSAAAFVTVQGAVNWLVDNYQRLADWRSSAHRVTSLLLVIDDMEAGTRAAVDDERRDAAKG
jgi:ABC-type uncharacterized transport system fused permease/ATPase subunit